jgi:hypothetical protein
MSHQEVSVVVPQGVSFEVDCPNCSRRDRCVAPSRPMGRVPVTLSESERVFRCPLSCRCGFVVACSAQDESGERWAVTIEIGRPAS